MIRHYLEHANPVRHWMRRTTSCGAPIPMAASAPSFAVPRGLSRLASAADWALACVGPVALWVVEQAAHLADGRSAAELPAVRESFPPGVGPLAAVVPPADCGPFLPAVVPLAAAPLAAALLAAALLAAELPAVVPKADGRCESAAAFRRAHLLPAG
jgi:hypothetical protein